MNARRIVNTAAYGALAGGAIATTGYAALVALNRATYGDGKTSADGAKDPVLDRFIPSPEVREHHQIRIHAPVEVVMAAARSSRRPTPTRGSDSEGTGRTSRRG